MNGPEHSGRVQVHRRAGERSSPDSGDLRGCGREAVDDHLGATGSGNALPACLGQLAVRTAGSQSPGSGDDLSPAWRRAWARREDSHGRQGTCAEIAGRYRDLTSRRRRQRRRPARLRADPAVRARPGPQRSGVLRRAGGAEPVLGHRRRLPVRVPDHPRRRSGVRRAAEHRPQPAPGRGRDRRRQRRDQHGDAPRLLPPSRRPRRRGLAVRRGRGPHRARGDPAAAAARRRPGPAGCRR